MHSADELKKSVVVLADDFESNGPFTDDVNVADALAYISAARKRLGELKAEEDQIRKGLGIFKLDQPPSHVLQSIEKVFIAYSTIFLFLILMLYCV